MPDYSPHVVERLMSGCLFCGAQRPHHNCRSMSSRCSYPMCGGVTKFVEMKDGKVVKTIVRELPEHSTFCCPVLHGECSLCGMRGHTAYHHLGYTGLELRAVFIRHAHEGKYTCLVFLVLSDDELIRKKFRTDYWKFGLHGEVATNYNKLAHEMCLPYEVLETPARDWLRKLPERLAAIDIARPPIAGVGRARRKYFRATRADITEETHPIIPPIWHDEDPPPFEPNEKSEESDFMLTALAYRP